MLKPGARGLFVMHHVGGSIAATCAARLHAYRHVIADGAVFRRGEAVFAKLGRGAPPALVVSEVARFRAAVSAAARRYSDKGPMSNTREAISFLVDLARAPDRFVPGDALRRLRLVEADIGEWALRQQAMLAAALDDAGIADVARALKAVGAEPDAPELYRSPSGEIHGWTLAFRKRA